MGQPILPVSAVPWEDLNPSLLPKQEGGLGLQCPKTGCPLMSPMGSFQKLHGWNQHEKPRKMIYDMPLSEQNQITCHSSWGWFITLLTLVHYRDGLLINFHPTFMTLGEKIPFLKTTLRSKSLFPFIFQDEENITSLCLNSWELLPQTFSFWNKADR